MENKNDLLSSLLQDPEALQKAVSAVSGMLGGTPQAEATAAPAAYDPTAELLSRALPVLQTITQRGQTAVRQEKRSLLAAAKPFVTEPVAGQFDHAIRLVSLAQMVRAALGELGRDATADADTRTL